MRARPVLLTDTSANAVAAGLAVTRDDLDQAECLVHEVYVARGLRDPARPLRVPGARHPVVFVARVGGTIAATLSLLRDSSRGLPLDALYGTELAALRASGLRLAEVGALAVERHSRGAALALVRPLVQLVGVYARDVEGSDELCIAVHPRHAPFYEGRFGFSRFGAEKAYGAVNNAPAVGLRLDLHRPPVPDALSAALFQPGEIARVRAALDADLRRLAAGAGSSMQILQFTQVPRTVTRSLDVEVC
jgi:N-acyl amino acid synthase FeeM